jgi:serine/threonine-protein kinase
MPTQPDGETLLMPADRLYRQEQTLDDSSRATRRGYVRKQRHDSQVGRVTTALPSDLVKQTASRLRTLSLLYAFTFVMAAFFPAFLVQERREILFQGPLHWLPGVLSIAVALSVVAAIQTVRMRPAVVTALALTFEVVSSYGIAAAEFADVGGLHVGGGWMGLSWVAVWMLLYNVAVPMLPRHAMFAALAAVTSVPVIVVVSLRLHGMAVGAVDLFFVFVFPYLLVVIMAYVGARVVYALGTEVSRARELGSYRLVQRLGVGGMGEVWKAEHRLLARPAAIKLIRSSISAGGAGVSVDARRRFEREAQVIAHLRSPHTVTLFDFGVADDGAFYYVMELLEGLDTDTLVKRFGPMPAERVVWILRQICHSLSEADSCGLVHRDIKPANIFLCRYGEDHDFAKVLDFGIAKPAHQTSTDQTALTIANVIQGTPAFIAPEQALGGVDLDIRADIYSVGCVAYWLMTGALVFTAETPMKVLLAHASAVPEPPSRKTELPIPPGLERLVLSCLEKDRANRPQTPRSLLDQLEAIVLDDPWTEDRARQWWITNLPQGDERLSAEQSGPR